MHADDVNVGSYLIYVNRNDIACFDEAGFYPINAAALENLYVKGVLISENGVLYTPLSKTLSGTDVALAFLAYDVAESEVVYRVASSSEEAPAIPFLASLNIGGKTLNPVFDPEVFLYAMSTEDESDILTLTTVLEDTHVVVKLNDVEVTDYEEGIIWGEGANVLTISVSAGNLSQMIYTVNVTKVAAPIAPRLASLTLGTLALTPSFDPDVFVYTASTTETSDVLTLTALPPEAVLEVKLGENVVTDYDTTGIVWAKVKTS
jgi:hypothetical protein